MGWDGGVGERVSKSLGYADERESGKAGRRWRRLMSETMGVGCREQGSAPALVKMVYASFGTESPCVGNRMCQNKI